MAPGGSPGFVLITMWLAILQTLALRLTVRGRVEAVVSGVGDRRAFGSPSFMVHFSEPLG